MAITLYFIALVVPNIESNIRHEEKWAPFDLVAVRLVGLRFPYSTARNSGRAKGNSPRGQMMLTSGRGEFSQGADDANNHRVWVGPFATAMATVAVSRPFPWVVLR